eukprot:1002394-Amorphochlora_amoeboformis.AAC.1
MYRDLKGFCGAECVSGSDGAALSCHDRSSVWEKKLSLKASGGFHPENLDPIEISLLNARKSPFAETLTAISTSP